MDVATSQGMSARHHDVGSPGGPDLAFLDGKSVGTIARLLDRLEDDEPAPITVDQTAKQLGIPKHAAVTLTTLGFFRLAPPRYNKPRHLLAPGATLQDAIDDWFARLPPPSSYEEWDAYVSIRTRLGIHATAEHPDSIRYALVTWMAPMGGISAEEVAATVSPGGREQRNQLVHDLRVWSGQAARRRHPAVQAIDLESFWLLLPPWLRELPTTALDPKDDRNESIAPSPAVLGTIAGIRHFFPFAATSILLVAAHARRTPTVETAARALREIDELVEETGVDWRNAEEFGRVLLEYARRRHREGSTDVTRYETVRIWQALTRAVRRYVRTLPDRTSGLILDDTPGRSPNPAKLNRAKGRLLYATNGSAWANRKGRVLAILRQRDQVLVTIDRRCDQISAVGDACRAAKAELLASDRDHIDFEVAGPVLRFDGSHGTGLQTIRMRATFEGAMLRQFADDRLRWSEESAHAIDKFVKERGDSRRVLFEHLGVEAEDEDGETCDPFWLRLLATMTTSHAIRMPTELREERRRLIIEHGLPRTRGTPEGLFSFDRSGAVALRAAAKRGRIVIPIEEFEHAIRFAHLAARTCLMTTARIHQAMQMTEQLANWPVVETPAGGRLAFTSIGKVPHDVDLANAKVETHVVDDETFQYRDSLAALTRERCHDGGSIPFSLPAGPLCWKIPQARFTFSYASRALPLRVLIHILPYLTAGLPRVHFHDLRHVGAAELRAADVSDEAIGLTLGNTPELAGYYASVLGERGKAATSLHQQRMAVGRRLGF